MHRSFLEGPMSNGVLKLVEGTAVQVQLDANTGRGLGTRVLGQKEAF